MCEHVFLFCALKKIESRGISVEVRVSLGRYLLLDGLCLAVVSLWAPKNLSESQVRQSYKEVGIKLLPSNKG